MAMEAQKRGKGRQGGDMEIWVKHYSSKHQMLLVGEGDFSFSLSLACSFGSARNITASSLDTLYELIKKYKKAKSTLANLEKLGAEICHGVDATKMKSDYRLNKYKFDRIVFNFPHAGFYGSEDNNDLIGMHRGLVEGFFRNAKDMLQVNGEIHVTHKTSIPFCNWDIEGLARRNDLAPIGYADFKIEDYPGYNNKRGAGNRSDEPFPLRECRTFKFGLSHSFVKMVSSIANPYSFSSETSLQHHHSPFQVLNPNPFQVLNLKPFHFGNCPPTLATNADYTTEHSQFSSAVCVSSKGANGLQGHRAYEENRTALYSINYPADKVQWPEPERFMMEAPGRSQQLLSDPIKLQHLTGPLYPCHRPSFTGKVYDFQGHVGALLAMNAPTGGINNYSGYLDNGLEAHSRPVTQLDKYVGKVRSRSLKQRMAETSGRSSNDYPYALPRILVSLYGQHQEVRKLAV